MSEHPASTEDQLALILQKLNRLQTSVDSLRATRLQELKDMPYKDYLQTPEWKATAIRKKDSVGHSCQVCDSTEKLNTHHRTYERRGEEEDNDLLVLCANCHGLFHNKLKEEKPRTGRMSFRSGEE